MIDHDTPDDDVQAVVDRTTMDVDLAGLVLWTFRRGVALGHRDKLGTGAHADAQRTALNADVDYLGARAELAGARFRQTVEKIVRDLMQGGEE